MKKAQQGFTLIELMIVVAIIGILAAIAMPAYQDYTIRAKVSEGLSLASSAKTAVTDYYVSQGSFPTSNSSAGLANTISSQYVSNVQVGAGGAITVTFSSPSAISGADMVFTPSAANGTISWTCTGGSLADKYRPANCR